jgi:hypothetical protein
MTFNSVWVNNILPAARISGDSDSSALAITASHSKFARFHSSTGCTTVHVEMCSIFLCGCSQICFKIYCRKKFKIFLFFLPALSSDSPSISLSSLFNCRSIRVEHIGLDPSGGLAVKLGDRVFELVVGSRCVICCRTAWRILCSPKSQSCRYT